MIAHNMSVEGQLEQLYQDVQRLQHDLAVAVNNDKISDSAYDYAYLHTEEIAIQIQYAQLALENR